MAAKTAKMLNDVDISGKNDRLLMNKLRDCGLEYVSSSGKIIPAKTQPEHFCHCPQKCKSKLSQEKWDELFERFYNLGDQNKQNQFLQSHIVIKAVHLHNWETEKSPNNKRRVTCKYHVPNLGEDSDLEEYIGRKGNDSVEVCQKAFMNCYGITEKRVRMQRERCISRLAPDHYKHSPFGKKHKITQDKQEAETFNQKIIELGKEIEITPLDLSNDKKKKANCLQAEEVNDSGEDKQESSGKDQPLDLSYSNCASQQPAITPEIGFDKTSLYEIAQKMGVPKETVDREMAQKYAEYLRKNIKKSQKGLLKNKKKKTVEAGITNYKTEIENMSPSRVAVGEQVAGLNDELILPIQTLNNGDLTITPVLSTVSKPVENWDIMRVNSFFQNQLWQPELIGLSSWRKLRNQTFDI